VDRSDQNPLGGGTAGENGEDVASPALRPRTGGVEFLVGDAILIAPIAVRWDAIDDS
jgi:hypothetical protein